MHSIALPIPRHIILASNSPRRRQLLATIAPDFVTAPDRHVDESYPADMPAMDVAPYISRKKAEAYTDLLTDDNVLITADTVVIVDNRILGKPKDEQEAIDMLTLLSGRTHQVVTGVTVSSRNRSETFSNTTEVTFDTIPEADIRSYVETYRPMDKAGAYGIQEWIGCRGIKGVKGCFYNVMGLPVNDLYNHLHKF